VRHGPFQLSDGAPPVLARAAGEKEMNDEKKYDICKRCGHYRFLHLNFGGQCEACDSPEYKMEERCFTFHEAVTNG
jgi:hypothetical protein